MKGHNYLVLFLMFALSGCVQDQLDLDLRNTGIPPTEVIRSTITPTSPPESPQPTDIPTFTPVPAPMPTLLPELKVFGNEILDEHGNQVILRGVSIADPYNLFTESHLWGEDAFRVLSEEWGVNIVRVPIHPLNWECEEEYAIKYLDPLIEWGNKYGIYIFLGWHAHGNPVTGEVEDAWSDWPCEGNIYNPDLDLTKAALKTMAERYINESHVLYGSFNEPSHITWASWRPIAEELVDVIHNINPQAIVFVSGTNWGYDLRGALYDPVKRKNIVYEIHPYPGNGHSWKSFVQQLKETTPVFIGEWGYVEYPDTNLRGKASSYGIPLIEYADKLGLGWTAWVWHPVWGPEMLISFNNYEPTNFGSLVKNSLMNFPLDSNLETPIENLDKSEEIEDIKQSSREIYGDQFEKLNSSNWYPVGDIDIQAGKLAIRGGNGFSTIFSNHKLWVGEGILLKFKASGNIHNAAIIIETGEFSTPSYSTAGFSIESHPQAGFHTLQEENLYLLSDHLGSALLPDTEIWYEGLIRILNNNEVEFMIWESNDPSRSISFVYAFDIPKTGLLWSMKAYVHDGLLELDWFYVLDWQ